MNLTDKEFAQLQLALWSDLEEVISSYLDDKEGSTECKVIQMYSKKQGNKVNKNLCQKSIRLEY